ncbi:uncharacterized protein LOC129797779 [Lutzomyia longipalpis]|uniref:Putative secreted protein n=1 Tax=Lutzomyia longipalpis TaxID=7200 RepID=A0A1B0CUS2_LUTLO|nr:uncharacterized protein LOC129797779 [Lutzomyia longipalpis]
MCCFYVKIAWTLLINLITRRERSAAESSFFELMPVVEAKSYFRLVDRESAEDLLRGKQDGACLVRPFKEKDDSIKYVLSVYAQEKFFHLHLRQTVDGSFVIGLEKAIEKEFSSPIHCVDYYRHNNLRCINSSGNVVVTLKPISE